MATADDLSQEPVIFEVLGQIVQPMDELRSDEGSPEFHVKAHPMGWGWTVEVFINDVFEGYLK